MGNLGVFCQRPGEVEIRCGILITPKCGGNGSNHQGNLSIRDAKERGRAPFENIRVGALRFPGKSVERRECRDATHRPWKDAAEKAQRFRECFGATIGIRDKKSRTPQFPRQVGRNESFGDIVQAGDGDVTRARTQSGQRALHRLMAKDGLQSLADGRKYHA